MKDRKEYRKRYREKNKEKIKEYSKKYYQDHKEYFNSEKRKEYNCQWSKNNLVKGRIRNLRYGKTHRVELAERQRQWQKERKQYIDDYKLSRGCSVCGYNKCAEVLDFHHSDCRKKGEKKFSIASSLKKGISLEIIKEEMNKCVILCANCHRE